MKPFGSFVILVPIYRHRVCFCVEYPLLKVNLLLISEQQVEVLQSLPEEERFHHVLGSQVQGVPDVTHGCVSVQHFGVLFNALKNKTRLVWQWYWDCCNCRCTYLFLYNHNTNMMEENFNWIYDMTPLTCLYCWLQGPMLSILIDVNL